MLAEIMTWIAMYLAMNNDPKPQHVAMYFIFGRSLGCFFTS